VGNLTRGGHWEWGWGKTGNLVSWGMETNMGGPEVLGSSRKQNEDEMGGGFSRVKAHI